MAFRVRMRKRFNIAAVVKSLVYVILSLYVGGTIITELGNVMNQSASPMYSGFSLIGWTVETVTNSSPTTCYTNSPGGTMTVAGCITSVSGTGILSVIGIIGIATVVMQFVKISF